jgi:hypothetical protein
MPGICHRAHQDKEDVLTCTRAVFNSSHGCKVRRMNSNNDDTFLNAALVKACRGKQLRELSKGTATTVNDRGNGIMMKPNNGGDDMAVRFLIGSSKRRRRLSPYC